jgi:hypothetical protein
LDLTRAELFLEAGGAKAAVAVYGGSGGRKGLKLRNIHLHVSLYGLRWYSLPGRGRLSAAYGEPDRQARDTFRNTPNRNRFQYMGQGYAYRWVKQSVNV